MQEESIYNIIPQEYVPPPKGRMYRSKYSPEVPPTSSTFINHTTSRPGVFSGFFLRCFTSFFFQIEPGSQRQRKHQSRTPGPHSQRRHQVIRPPKRSPEAQFEHILKTRNRHRLQCPKHSSREYSSLDSQLLPSIPRASRVIPILSLVHHENSLEKYYSESRKEAIPKKADKPIMGLKSDKNFIVSNAVDNITAGIYSHWLG